MRAVSGTGRCGVDHRLGPDPQPRDARRQPVQRLAGGRHGAGLLVYGARLDSWPASPASGALALDDFFVRSGVTGSSRGELVTAIELPMPRGHDRLRFAATHTPARTRPGLGHDGRALDEAGGTRLAYGVLGPRPSCSLLPVGEPPSRGMVRGATPSPTSMRAWPEYRLAMLRVLAARALAVARCAPRGGA